MTDRYNGTRAETVHVALPATLASLIVIPLVAFILGSCASSPRQTPAPRDTTDTMAASQQRATDAASSTAAAGDTSGSAAAAGGDTFTMPDVSLFTQMQSGLLYYDVVQGTGFTAVNLREVKVHYTGMLQNGTIFDSSRQKGVPIEFTLGQGRVIRGWDQGIRGMKAGGRRILIIPPSLAYGDQGSGPIPANATLVFDVQLVGVR